MKQLNELLQHYQSLSQRDQKLAVATSIFVVITLFYIAIWEPIHLKLEGLQQNNSSQKEIYAWMQNAAKEVSAIKASGGTSNKTLKRNSPVSMVTEQSANTGGLKKYISKIESSGKNSTQVKIDNAAFNQVLLWINTLKTKYGISVASAKFERTDKEGIINARLTLRRME